MEKLASGCDAIDELLKGGYEAGIISTIYGPGGSGKTNLCMTAAINAINSGKKVIFIDTEGGFSVERLKQLTPDYKDILSKIVMFHPTSYEEQKKVFDKLKDVKKGNIGLIIVDTIAMFYRLEIGRNSNFHEINTSFRLQSSFLIEIARKNQIPILVTNQVYASFDERDKVNIVGGDVLKYGSKCLIELQNFKNNRRKAIIKKHRSISEGKSIIFEIKEKGLFKCE